MGKVIVIFNVNFQKTPGKGFHDGNIFPHLKTMHVQMAGAQSTMIALKEDNRHQECYLCILDS